MKIENNQGSDNIPKLRFPEFKGKWEKKKFEEIVKINQGLQIAITERFTEKVDNSYFYITNEFLKENSDKKYYIQNPTQSVLCTKDDILMTRTGNTGMVVTNVEGAFHNNFFKIAFPKFIDKIFLYNFLKLPNTQNLILKMAGTSTIPDLNHSDFYRILFTFPTLPEQQKIATFLTSVDEKLLALKKKKSLLEQYKKGVMQGIFCLNHDSLDSLDEQDFEGEIINNKEKNQEKKSSQSSQSQKSRLRLRFKDENGNDFPEWEEKTLGEVTVEVKRDLKDKSDFSNLDVLTISSEKGFVTQKERFSQIIAGDSLSKYTLLKKGEMSYNRGASKRFQFGCFYILNEYEIALVPNVYISFSFSENCNSVYFNHLFSTGFANQQLRQFISSSVRLDGLLNINKNDFFSIKINVPCLTEQTLIANFLTSIDDKINHCGEQIAKMEVWKKGLLQGMFC